MTTSNNTTNTPEKRKLSVNTSVYNERRYGKPWIAKVTFQSASKSSFDWGEWCGEAGHSGLLELDVSVGDIIAEGQKDNRKPRNSAPVFYVVRKLPENELESTCHDDMQEGGFLEMISKPEAYKLNKEVS